MPIDYYLLIFPAVGVMVIGIVAKTIIILGFGKNSHDALIDFDEKIKKTGNFKRGKRLPPDY